MKEFVTGHWYKFDIDRISETNEYLFTSEMKKLMDGKWRKCIAGYNDCCKFKGSEQAWFWGGSVLPSLDLWIESETDPKDTTITKAPCPRLEKGDIVKYTEDYLTSWVKDDNITKDGEYIVEVPDNGDGTIKIERGKHWHNAVDFTLIRKHSEFNTPKVRLVASSEPIARDTTKCKFVSGDKLVYCNEDVIEEDGIDWIKRNKVKIRLGDIVTVDEMLYDSNPYGSPAIQVRLAYPHYHETVSLNHKRFRKASESEVSSFNEQQASIQWPTSLTHSEIRSAESIDCKLNVSCYAWGSSTTSSESEYSSKDYSRKNSIPIPAMTEDYDDNENSYNRKRR